MSYGQFVPAQAIDWLGLRTSTSLIRVLVLMKQSGMKIIKTGSNFVSSRYILSTPLLAILYYSI